MKVCTAVFSLRRVDQCEGLTGRFASKCTALYHLLPLNGCIAYRELNLLIYEKR